MVSKYCGHSYPEDCCFGLTETRRGRVGLVMVHRPNVTQEIIFAPESDIQELAVAMYAGERLAGSCEFGMAAVDVSATIGAQMERLLTRVHGALVSSNVLAVFVLPSEYKQQL
jgi:hypothetical protein